MVKKNESLRRRYINLRTLVVTVKIKRKKVTYSRDTEETISQLKQNTDTKDCNLYDPPL